VSRVTERELLAAKVKLAGSMLLAVAASVALVVTRWAA